MSRNISLDLLKFAMALMVVALHSRFLQDIDPQISYILVNGLFRIAVPTFFVINGFYFFLSVERNQFLRWFQRITILTMFWIIIYSYFWIPDWSMKTFISIVEGYYHLWYLHAMIGAGILLLIFKRLSLPLLISLMLIGYIMGVVLQYVSYYQYFAPSELNITLNHIPNYRNTFMTAFPYFGCGYLIHRYELHNKIPRSYLYIALGLGLILLFSESYYNYHLSHRRKGFDNLASLILVCPSLVILILGFKTKAKSKSIALCASGIYFVHIFFLLLLREYTNFSHTVLTLLTILMSIPTSILLVFIHKRTGYIL